MFTKWCGKEEPEEAARTTPPILCEKHHHRAKVGGDGKRSYEWDLT